jgi:alkylmercury lyase
VQQHPSLETIAQRLAEQLRCEQEDLCLPILQQVSRGIPATRAELGARLKLDQDELERRLIQLPDTEFDHQGNILGWGVTLVPTSHHFQMRGKPLYTWCAFDTVLFPPSLRAEAQVQSTCPVTGQPVTFVATPEGVVKELTPASSVMSLIIPEQRSDCVRATFCQRSLFFQSEHVASTFLTAHPETVLLSIEEAAYVGWLVARTRFTKTRFSETGKSEDAHGAGELS